MNRGGLFKCHSPPIDLHNVFFCLFAFFIDRDKSGALKKLREIFRNLFLILLISHRTKNKLNSTLNGEERKTVSIMSSSASFHVSKFSFFTHV